MNLGNPLSSLNGYYPKGMVMPGRNFDAVSGYRYGFNGKENDMEYGTGSLTQDYGFRMYNPALGRFLSVDPLTASYPWYTPYQFAGNKVIWAIDLDGLEEAYVTGSFEETLSAYNNLFEKAWSDSFSHKNRKGGTVAMEYGAVLVVRTATDLSTGVQVKTYEFINYKHGTRGSWEADFETNRTPDMEVIGHFHTHPYPEGDPDYKTGKRLYPNFDGLGVVFSSPDLASFSSDLRRGDISKGDILFVVAGDAIYALEIVDPEKARKTMSSQSFLLGIDYADADMPKSGDFGEQSWANFVGVFEKAGGEEYTGIKLHSATMGSTDSADPNNEMEEK